MDRVQVLHNRSLPLAGGCVERHSRMRLSLAAIYCHSSHLSQCSGKVHTGKSTQESADDVTSGGHGTRVRTYVHVYTMNSWYHGAGTRCMVQTPLHTSAVPGTRLPTVMTALGCNALARPTLAFIQYKSAVYCPRPGLCRPSTRVDAFHASARCR